MCTCTKADTEGELAQEAETLGVFVSAACENLRSEKPNYDTNTQLHSEIHTIHRTA